jgi:hypothetical protein
VAGQGAAAGPHRPGLLPSRISAVSWGGTLVAAYQLVTPQGKGAGPGGGAAVSAALEFLGADCLCALRFPSTFPLLQPVESATSYVFLASQEASFMTGQVTGQPLHICS